MVSSVDHAVIVIGAGPAGLAVGACLRQKGIPSIILEQNGQVGSAWYRHYDRLHLHTDKRNSQLPLLLLSICIPQSRLPSRPADANAPILRAVIGDLTEYGLRKLPYGPMTQVQRDGHIPLIDVGTIEWIKKGQVKTPLQ